MLVQSPRLTGSLRESPFDVDLAYRHRKNLLKLLRPPRTHDDSELARRLVHRWDEASIEIRHAYRKFIGAVVELMNGDIVNGEFQEVAMKTYDLFSRVNANSDADLVTTTVLQKK